MRVFRFLAMAIFLIGVQESRAQASADEASLYEKAIAIHESVITIDTHNDISVDNFTDSINYTQDLETQVNLPKMEKGGLDVSWLIVYTGQGALDEEGYSAAYENAMSKFDAIHRLVNDYAPDQIALALTAEDVRRIIAQGKKVAMIGVENAYPLGVDLENIQKFYDLGARYMSLAHNGHNQFSDSNTGEADQVWLHGGLSPLGEKAVEEMNRLGIMIDISHPSREAIKQMIRLSKAPVLASHSSARALCDVSRNLDDGLLDLVKDNGGVVQVVALHEYLNNEKFEANEQASTMEYREVAREHNIPFVTRQEMATLSGDELEKAWENYEKVARLSKGRKTMINKIFPPVSVVDLVDHIDYMVSRMGIDHVGISSDFDGGGGIQGWEDASETFNVTLELVRRGYSEEEIAKLWGLNLLRVLEEVELVAKELQGRD